MFALTFETAPAAVEAANRADVALFVGFVPRREDANGLPTALPTSLLRWLGERGWLDYRYVEARGLSIKEFPRGLSPYAKPDDEIDALLDVPVVVDSWAVFDSLFAWDKRQMTPESEFLDDGIVGDTYLGAAVRAFFAQGGRKCYVVRVGDPFMVTDQGNVRMAALETLIPGNFTHQFESSPVDPASWKGVGHLFGLPDVSFVCLPDLVDACADAPIQIPDDQPDTPVADEQFVECSDVEAPPTRDDGVKSLDAPRLDEFGFRRWALAVNLVGQVISSYRREVQYVVALPIPDKSIGDFPRFLGRPDMGLLARGLDESRQGIGTAFVQLAYPWLRTNGSAFLPEGLESPDGTLTGLLARNALARGTFRSAANQTVLEVFDVFPPPSFEETHKPQVELGDYSLIERVSLFGFTPEKLTLLSDVTASRDEAYRLASINRLFSLVVRAARRVGENSVFEPNGEQLWKRLTDHLTGLMSDLLAVGALRGRSAQEAFSVRCDRSTMTQNDLDNGRLVCEISFAPAAPIEQITVVLALNNSGQVNLLLPEVV